MSEHAQCIQLRTLRLEGEKKNSKYALRNRGKTHPESPIMDVHHTHIQFHKISQNLIVKKRPCKYNVLLRRVRETTVIVEKQLDFNITNVRLRSCLGYPAFSLPLPHKRHDLRGQKNYWTLFLFSLQLLSETHIILRIITQNNVINVPTSSSILYSCQF